MNAENPTLDKKRWSRVYCGGGWPYYAMFVRVSEDRGNKGPSRRDDFLGFRLVRNK